MAEAVSLRDDLVRGLEEIALELGVSRSLVLELITSSNIPVFRIGHVYSARRSTLAAWIAAKELKALMSHPDA